MLSLQARDPSAELHDPPPRWLVWAICLTTVLCLGGAIATLALAPAPAETPAADAGSLR
jgi:hypothetical protein